MSLSCQAGLFSLHLARHCKGFFQGYNFIPMEIFPFSLDTSNPPVGVVWKRKETRTSRHGSIAQKMRPVTGRQAFTAFEELLESEDVSRMDRVGQRCTLNLSRAETFSRWCGVVVRRGGCQLRYRPRHLTRVQNYMVRRQKPSCDAEQCDVNIHSLKSPEWIRYPDLNPSEHVWDVLGDAWQQDRILRTIRKNWNSCSLKSSDSCLKNCCLV
ncbi:uncharacterized protein TNCV_1335581 [Trichonephila clavipes]|nr:uncharacterized protein TNCV_1335581 [Trichonephila clavipes]